MTKDNFRIRASTLLVGLVALYVGLSVSASAGAVKVISLPFGTGASVTVFAFLGSLLVNNTINEIYGRTVAHVVIRVALIANLIAVLVFFLASLAPPAQYWIEREPAFNRQEAYAFVLGPAFRFVLAGQVAVFLSRTFIAEQIHRARERGYFRRQVVSTLLGDFLDTCIFVSIAFYGQASLLKTIGGQFLVKAVFIMIVLHPILLIVTSFLKDSVTGVSEIKELFESCEEDQSSIGGLSEALS